MPMLEGTGSIGLGPTGMFESMIHASSSGILLESGGKVTRCGRIAPAITMRPRVHMRATAADITANTWYTPRRHRYDVWGGALRIPKHPKMLVWGICRHSQCCDNDFWHALGSHMVGMMSVA